MASRKRARTKRKNKTAHRRAIADPEAREVIVHLRRYWEKIDRTERGDKLRNLANRGCSTRGLGEALGQSATTIRRHMTLAGLPEQELVAIRAGASAKKILAAKARDARIRRMQQRVALDVRTGELSDSLANTILAFCKTVDGVPSNPIAEEFLVTFLSEVRNAAWAMEAVGIRPLRLPKRLTIKQRFLQARPPVKDTSLVENLSRWLAIIVLAEASERPIWELAIEKAGRRSEELRIKKSAAEARKEKGEQRLRVWYNPPRRPVYPGGARAHMKRQGQDVPKGPRDL